METKNKLKVFLSEIWKEAIKNEFKETGFMWERHLQAVFYHHLRNTLYGLNI